MRRNVYSSAVFTESRPLCTQILPRQGRPPSTILDIRKLKKHCATRRWKPHSSNNFPLHVYQCHKSRWRLSEVTVGVTRPLDTRSCQVWNLYLTSRRYSVNGNVATCREVPENRGNFALYISKTISRTTKVSYNANIFGPSTIRCNAQIRRGPKGRCWSARDGSVPQKPKLSFSE